VCGEGTFKTVFENPLMKTGIQPRQYCLIIQQNNEKMTFLSASYNLLHDC
jgi:hypothetical protein